MTVLPRFRWLDKLARTVRGKQRRSPRRSVSCSLVLEHLEDRIAPASDITIITSGVGSLDSVLAANNGVITVNDGANGGTQTETLSATALQALPGTDNINIAARNSITFNDLTPVGGTLALLTEQGHSAVFSTTSGAIAFANSTNTLTTVGGQLQFTAGTNLTLGNLNTSASAGGIDLQTGSGGTLTSGTSTTNALLSCDAIHISADNIVLKGGISASSSSITLQQATGMTGGGLFTTTRSIDIGGGTTPGELDITDAELGLIHAAGPLRIGRLDNPGNITITENAAGTGGITMHPGFNTLDLRSGGNISAADGNATIDVNSLAVEAVGNDGAATSPLVGQVTTLAANVTGHGSSFKFFNSGSLSIGNINGVNGVTTNDGEIQLFANASTLTVASNINSQGGSVGLGGSAFVNVGTTTIQGAISTGGGQLVIVADNMDLQAGTSINVGIGRVSLIENSDGTLINLGGADSTSPLTLGLTAVEINTITAGTLQIGDNRAGSITLSAAIAPAHVATLDLQTGNAISEGANGSLTVANLALQAVNSIGDNGPAIQLIGPTNVAFRNTTSGNVVLDCTGALTVTAVDTLNGTPGNTIGDFGEGVELTANGGPLTFAISTSGTAVLGTTTGSSAGQNNITVNSGITLTSSANGDVSLVSVDNILLQTGSTITAPAASVFLGAGAHGIDTTATLINVGTVSGINVNLSAPGDIGVGTVTAGTTATIASANGAILDNNDTATAAVLNITATNLSLSAFTGIGVPSTALNINATQAPLETQVSNVQAETATGGIFIDNGFVTPTALTVGFSGQPLANAGVQVTGASGDIQLINNGSIDITNQDLSVQGPGNVTVQANGAAADVTTGGDVVQNAIRGNGAGVVTVQAGQDITLGNAKFGQVHSVSGSIVLEAGRNLTSNSMGFVEVNNGMGAITATAGGDITLQGGMFTSGGAINLSTGVGGTVTLDPASIPTTSFGGNITVSADNIALNSAINAGTGIVTLEQATGGAGSTTRNIDIGGGTTAGDLDITDTALGQITAGVVRIGRLDNTGNITVTPNGFGVNGITIRPGFNTLDLRSGGSILSSGLATIAVDNLALQSVGNVGGGSPLIGQVANLAGNITRQGDGLLFKNEANLSIGSVDGVNGLTTNDGEIAAIADAFTITVTDTPAAADINSHGGFIGLMSKFFVNQGTTTVGAAIDSGGGAIDILADNMDLQAGSTINAGTGRVILTEDQDGTPIDLGAPSSTTPLTLGLTEAEINSVTASTLQIGDPNADNITITAAIAPAHVSTLVLLTPGAIVEGTNGSLSVANLALLAGKGIGDAGAIQLVGPTNLAFRNNANGNVMISDNGALTVTAVDSLNDTNGNNIGNFASGGAIFLTANGGPLTFAISTSSDSITQATTTTTAAGQNNITVNSGVTVAAVENNGVSFFSVDNILLQTGSAVASTKGSDFLAAGFGGIDTTATLINNGAITGVNVTLSAPGDIGVGTVTAGTTATITSGNGAILDNNDTTTAAVLNITATNLSLSASTGIGVPSTALNINATQAPLETQVANLQAQTVTGGIFLDNGFVAPTPLAIGFSGQPLAGVGVQVTGASGDIQLVNNGSINVTTPGDTILGPGNVTIRANGATSDVTTGAGLLGNLTAIVGNGLVTVQAGQDITLGTANFGEVISTNGSIALNAGRNLNSAATGLAAVFLGTGTITATAGGDITLQQGLQTKGGAINLTTGLGGTVSLNPSTLPVTSQGGNITISADNIDLQNGALNAGAGIVTLQQATGGTGSTTRNIDLGGGTTTGDLNLSDTELGQITAGVVRIGRLGNAGNITITQNSAGSGGITTHTGFNTLDLRSGGTIMSATTNMTPGIAVANLAVQAAGNVQVLNTSVSTLAASLTGSGSSILISPNAQNLTIGSVDGVNGITTDDGNVNIVSNAALTVADTPAAADVNSQGGKIALLSTSFTSSGTTTAGAALNSGGGQISIFADSMDLQVGSTIDAGTGRAILAGFNANTSINLGGANSTSPLTLGLSESEINTVTAGTLQIGAFLNAKITISAAIAPAHVATLDLQAGEAIVEGTNGSLTVPNLALQAISGIGDAGAIQLVGPTNLAFANLMMGNVMISDNGPLTITAVDTLNNTNGNNIGNFGNGGGIALMANDGPLTFALSTTSNGATSASTAGAAGQNDITVNSGVTVASLAANNVTLNSVNNIRLQSGSTVQSQTGNVELFIGANDANTVSAALQGKLVGTSPTVQSGNGNATVLVDFANGATLPNGLTFTGGSGNNALNVSDANDNIAHTYAIAGGSIVRDSTTINYTKVANVTVTGGNQADTFNVAPSAATTFTLKGGSPTPPTLPGDTLNVNLGGTTTPQLTQTFSPASGFSGAWTFGNAAPVNFTGMETLLPALAQLAVTLNAAPNPVLANGTLTYTVTVTNDGAASAQNVVLSDTLPNGETFVSQTQNTGPAFTPSNNGDAISDTIATLPSGASASFTIVAHVSSNLPNNTTLTNTATASTTTTQTSTTNNSATAATTVNAQADLSVNASGPTANLFGNTLTYTYTLADNGPSSAANVVLTASLPVGANVVSASQLSGNDPFAGAVNGNTVLFTAPMVAAGDNDTFQVIVSVAGGAGKASSLRGTATVASSTFDPNMANNSAATPTSLQSVLNSQLQANQQAAGLVLSPAGEMTALQQFLFWFGNASSISSGAVSLVIDELLLTLGETAMANGLPLQGFVSAQEAAIVSNPLYGTVAGYELGLWTDAVASVLF